MAPVVGDLPIRDGWVRSTSKFIGYEQDSVVGRHGKKGGNQQGNVGMKGSKAQPSNGGNVEVHGRPAGSQVLQQPS